MRDLVLSFDGNVLEQVGSFKYLGLVLSRNGSFTAAFDSLYKSALKLLHMLRSMSQRAGITSPDVLCSLFAAIILPVIEYGSEIWGTKQYMQLERFFLKFLKEILCLPYNATNNAVYGDTASFSCWIRTYTQVVNYFQRITDG